jgi:hypothetical protein
VKRRTRIVIAGIASVGGAVAGAQLYLRHQAERMENFGVTLYSQPNYRGTRRTLPCLPSPQNVCALSETRLPRVGSIRVQRVTDTFRPALFYVATLPGWVLRAVLEHDEREPGDWLDIAAPMLNVLNPSQWRADRHPAGDRQSWVRLWADQPTYPLPSRDDAAGPDGPRWHDVLTDIPDLGPWSTRTRYLEFGVRSPYRAPSSERPDFKG